MTDSETDLGGEIWDREIAPTTLERRTGVCYAPLVLDGVTVARCELHPGHLDARHAATGFPPWEELTVLEERQRFGYRAPEERAADVPGIGGTHLTNGAEPAKSSPSDDLRAIQARSSTPPDYVFGVPANIVEACGCEESISLAERLELLETLLWDVSVVADFNGAHIECDLVEHVRQLLSINRKVAAKFGDLVSRLAVELRFGAGSYGPDEILSRIRSLRENEHAATETAARLTLHNRMLLGLIEGMAREAPRAPAKPKSALARARSLCAEGLEIAGVVGMLGIVIAATAAEAALAAIEDNVSLSEALGGIVGEAAEAVR